MKNAHILTKKAVASVAIVALSFVPATTALAGTLNHPAAPVANSLSPSSIASVAQGYWMVASDGGTFSFGDAGFFGSMGGTHLNAPIVGMAGTPDGQGYWMVASDGGIFSFGDAQFHGSTGAIHLNQPMVGMAAMPDGGGYWLVASDGGVFAFGSAHFQGSTGSIHLNKPIVGMASTPDGGGYWLVASDGGIFAFGDAHFFGSMGGTHLNRAIVGMASNPGGGGYWLVASDGGIFSFGPQAAFFGSMGGTRLNAPIVGMASTPDGRGYWMVASDGGIFTFGDAAFFGSMGGTHLNAPIVGMASGLTGGPWHLTFDDEFNETQLNTNNWQPNWLGGSNSEVTPDVSGSYELSCYDPKQVTVGGGSLILTALHQPCTTTKSGETYQYDSGLVNTRAHYYFTYGFIEARIWVPTSTCGSGDIPEAPATCVSDFPTFWASGVSSSYPEIDVMEGLQGLACFHYHYNSHSAIDPNFGGCPTLSQPGGWHVYAADWEPGRVTYYYDGENVGTITSQLVPNNPMFLILSLGVPAEWTDQTPASLQIDYVQVWQH